MMKTLRTVLGLVLAAAVLVGLVATADAAGTYVTDTVPNNFTKYTVTFTLFTNATQSQVIELKDAAWSKSPEDGALALPLTVYLTSIGTQDSLRIGLEGSMDGTTYFTDSAIGLTTNKFTDEGRVAYTLDEMARYLKISALGREASDTTTVTFEVFLPKGHTPFD